MLAYMFNIGKGDLSAMLIYNVDRFIGDLCQHRFSMSAYTFNDGIGDICQHTCSMLTLFNAMQW